MIEKKNHFKKLKENLKDKSFWKQELKKISFSDILIWIAIILMFMASWQNIQAGNDPCSYCIIRNLPGGDMTCKEYFDTSRLNISFDNDESFKVGNIREAS